MNPKLIKAVARYRKVAGKVRYEECDKQALYDVLSYAEQIIRQLEAELLVLAASQGEAAS